MHYYIDGYNFLFRGPSREGNLAIERRELIIQIEAAARALPLDVTLVFDGQFRSGDQQRSHFGVVEILFSMHGESADELILAEITSSLNPRQETVVTSDRTLAKKARLLKAHTITIEEFIKTELKRTPKKRLKPLKKEPIPLPSSKPLQVDEGYLKIFEARLKSEERENPVAPQTASDLVRWLTAFENPREENDSFL